MEFHNSSGFPSRRSYPNLNHVSLAPLTPRFPIDDDLEPEDYFGQTKDNDPSGSAARTSSYLSSVSVPSTPPILSHSRSTSRTRHHSRSKSSTRATPLSDINLQSQTTTLPLHHLPGAFSNKRHSHRNAAHTPAPKSDAEWMLRAGIALASSTREEKGQSWLSKRESSTSLVSMPYEDPAAPTHTRHHQRTKSGASSRKSRSGASTPAFSRCSSRSRVHSRRGSRAGLAMTSMPPLSTLSTTTEGKASSPATGDSSPAETRGRSHGLVPDFVDERIRAEMASLQRERALSDEGSGEYLGEEDEESESDYDGYSDSTPDDFDEADLQALTRERGFGLGTWLDRLVEWTLFGVDELPVAVSTPVPETRIGATATTTTVTFEEPGAPRETQRHDTLSLASDEGRVEQDDADALSHTDGESVVEVEKPGSFGGWEDASWLFRVVKRALI